LSRLRSWLVERSFAFLKCSSNLARMTLRSMGNVAKRCLMHAAGYNLSLAMRHLYRHGTAREVAGLFVRLFWPAVNPIIFLKTVFPTMDNVPPVDGLDRCRCGLFGLPCDAEMAVDRNMIFSTGCQHNERCGTITQNKQFTIRIYCGLLHLIFEKPSNNLV
jgi:hypothetical protein